MDSPQQQDYIITIERTALEQAMHQQGDAFYRSIGERHAHLFAPIALFISQAQYAQMQAVIAAVEQVVKLPGWLEQAYPVHAAKGVFFGYDFHLNAEGAHLIEINSNAGGAFLNALLLQSQAQLSLPGKALVQDELAHALLDMFRNEWRLERGDAPLQCIAIVDENPVEQYLYPEFILAQQLFEQAGIKAVITAPEEFILRADGVYLREQKIDLLYNRLTDFLLEQHSALSQACRENKLVVTPSPQAYQRYADKRNLVRLSDAACMQALGLAAHHIAALQQGIPQVKLVNAADAEQWWTARKQWFFKPVSGYGAKGAYRGDKITKRVFDEIIAGDYVAQKLAAPGECRVNIQGVETMLKYDVRAYVYDGQIQLVAARLYQGQTTNFRTAGGGFAMVRLR